MLAPSPQVQERIKQIWDEKLRVTEKEKGEGGLPHIIQLSRRLKLSEKETLVMTYILTHQMTKIKYSSWKTGRYKTMAPGYTDYIDCPGLILRLPWPHSRLP